MRHAIYDIATGAIIGYSEGETAPSLPPGFTVFELAGDEAAAGSIVNGVRVPPPPVEPTIAEVRSDRLEQVEMQLAGAIARGCQTSVGLVQCDKASTDTIANKVVSALAAKLAGNAAWRQAWRLMDNSWSVQMTADEMIAFAQQVEAHVQAGLAAYWASKDAITAAASIAAIDAVDITAGYPA